MADQFDELYVVSDLHLGGPPDAAVFDSSEQLAALIAWAGARARVRHVALIFAGDIIDFLAFPRAEYFNPTHAVGWLRSLDAPNAPTRVILDALRAFTGVPNAHLILLGGNHDIELALPEVQAVLLSLVATTAGSCQRVIARFDGTGYTCSVGGRQVLCVHGNERDEWNAIDHGALRRWIRDANVGRRPALLEPNAGTRLVIDVMNPIKSTLPFIDLLKPEEEAVPNVLVSLDAKRRNLGIGDVVRRAIAIIRRKREDRQRIERGVLGSEQLVDIGLFRDQFEDDGEQAADIDVDKLYSNVEIDFANDCKPLDVVSQPMGSLDALNTIAVALGIGVRKNLKQALWDAWVEDAGFDARSPDATFMALDSWVGRDVDVLIAGHTHLEKHIAPCPRRPHGVYLNTGTWIRLIKLEPRFLDGPAFDQLIDALTVRTMAELDAAEVAGSRLVIRRRTVGFVEHDLSTQKVRVGLRRVRDDARTSNVELHDPFDALSSSTPTTLAARTETQ